MNIQMHDTVINHNDGDGVTGLVVARWSDYALVFWADGLKTWLRVATLEAVGAVSALPSSRHVNTD